ncbi:MAG TPA: hypothetical protein VGQ31_08320 [Candidatus Limnocylindrales bacterium]|nr:hypothetical protein [Candidatus Limnocylindrales bacterium]
MNLVLAYGWGGLWLLIGLWTVQITDPGALGDGLFGSWVATMYWLAFGAPLVLFVLIWLELGLRLVPRPRPVAVAIALVPGAVVAIFALPEPSAWSIPVWLWSTGLAFGLTMRLPPGIAREAAAAT